MWTILILVGTNHISGMADRLRRCQLSSLVSVKLFDGRRQLLMTPTIEICIAAAGRVEGMV